MAVVDLVKIRKKAREQKEREAAEAALKGSSPPGDQSAVADSSAEEPSAADRLELFRHSVLSNATADAETRDEERIEADAEGAIEVLTFVIANEEYAIDIELVVEIMIPGGITRVPNADRNITGIISLRGTIVTILDIRRTLGHEPGTVDPDSRIVVVRDSGGSAGFMVDKVLRVVKMRPEELEAQPVATPEERNDMIKGVFRRTGSLSILLDIDRLLGTGDASHDAHV
jgi:purine-binding chemotaxis protein CheW